jgi:hypothetical protein
MKFELTQEGNVSLGCKVLLDGKEIHPASLYLHMNAGDFPELSLKLSPEDIDIVISELEKDSIIITHTEKTIQFENKRETINAD